MRLTVLVLATVVCAVGVLCDNYGYGYYLMPVMPPMKPKGGNWGPFLLIILVLLLFIPNLFTTGLSNFASAITGNGMSSNNSYGGGGNVPMIG